MMVPGCELKRDDRTSHSTSESNAVLEVFRRHCLKCHGAKHRDADIDLLDHNALHGDARGLVLSAAAAQKGIDNAKLWVAVAINGDMPPYDETPLSAAEIETIRRWLLAGAPPLILPEDGSLRSHGSPSEPNPE